MFFCFKRDVTLVNYLVCFVPAKQILGLQFHMVENANMDGPLAVIYFGIWNKIDWKQIYFMSKWVMEVNWCPH